MGKERRIFKFSPELTLLDHFRIESPREISNRKILKNFKGAFEWADPTAINSTKDIIFYPAGMGKVGIVTVTGQDSKPKFGYCFDSASKSILL